jgi:prevent-host-death family protein
MKHRLINVTEFKAKCLSLLDDVGEHGGVITITKRGRPLATVSPARRSVVRDVLEADTSALWEVSRGRPKDRA